MTQPPVLSVVIPTLDEVGRIEGLLAELAPLEERLPTEVVIADGGSGDGTREVARAHGRRVVLSDPGRGTQLRSGARVARGRWLLFLHADSCLSAETIRCVAGHVERDDGNCFAHFRFELSDKQPGDEIIEWGQRLRETFLKVVYGDQGLLVSRELYEHAGGYPPWSLFEDVYIIDRLSRVGRRRRLDAALPTSARRYRAEGRLRALARNVTIATAYRLGADPESLAARYAPMKRRSTRTVVLFAKEPKPGFVKTRLAKDIGDDEAASVYRSLARTAVDNLRGGGWKLLVYSTPPDPASRARVASWLNVPVGSVRPQLDGDLGVRMARALRECLADADRVCIVGSDVPGVDVELLDEAFAALSDSDVVLGPAVDGGYYLIGSSAPVTELFRDIPWSTERVLEYTRTRADAEGWTVALLRELRDVDTIADLPESLRSAS